MFLPLADPGILAEITKMEEQVKALKSKTVGYSKVLLDGVRKHCRLRECNLGNEFILYKWNIGRKYYIHYLQIHIYALFFLAYLSKNKNN